VETDDKKKSILRGFTINVRRKKSRGNKLEAAIRMASTGLPRVGFSIINPHRKPQEECERES
jgi:hypothetical protein